MSKTKGAVGEREWASICRDEGYDAHRGRQYHGGEDSPDVVGLPLLHVEVKRVEALRLDEAMAQARRDAGEKMVPIVAHRKNRQPWMVTMLAEDWFKLYREWEAGQLPFTEE